LLAAAVGGLFCAATARGLITSPYFGTSPDGKTIQIEPYPQIIQFAVGADRFYNAGFFGSRTILTNVEGGYVWPGQESTNRSVAAWIADPTLTFATPQYDYHATAVGFTLAGLGPQDANGYYSYAQLGMAPAAALVSAAIATDWPDHSGAFNTSNRSFTYAYQTALAGTGLYNLFFPNSGFGYVGIRSDVVNSSWGFSGDPAGTAYETRAIDALIYSNHNVVCLAAGNDGGAPVSGPASGYNAIAVGALASDVTNPPFSTLADFSSTGPNDFYNPVTRITTYGVRPGVSIVAPGTNLYLATYAGQTGTNSDGHLFDGSGLTPADLAKYAAQLYFTAAAGTSFASPIVAGGAALVVDAGYATFGGGESIDGRVIKAVLLNSADKPDGWTNHSSNVGGVQVTTQSLDYRYGSGALNLNRAYDQYLSGTANLPGLTGGTVDPLGWDYGQVAEGTPNVYAINTALHGGQILTVTLDWFVNRSLNASDLDNPVAADVCFDRLDVEIWSVVDGVLTARLAAAQGVYNNVDHLYFSLPTDGHYALEVLWAGNIYDVLGNSPHLDDYGLAWAVVPEPASLGLLLMGAVALLRRRTRR